MNNNLNLNPDLRIRTHIHGKTIKETYKNVTHIDRKQNGKGNNTWKRGRRRGPKFQRASHSPLSQSLSLSRELWRRLQIAGREPYFFYYLSEFLGGTSGENEPLVFNQKNGTMSVGPVIPNLCLRVVLSLVSYLSLAISSLPLPVNGNTQRSPPSNWEVPCSWRFDGEDCIWGIENISRLEFYAMWIFFSFFFFRIF